MKLVAAAMTTARVRRRASLEVARGDGWTTLTELADTLVRDHGLPFRSAHADRRATHRWAEGRRAGSSVAVRRLRRREVSGSAVALSETRS